MNSIVSFFKDVRFELSKVTWPKKNEVIRLTLTIFIVSAIIGIYVGGLDFAFTKLLELFVSF